MIVLLLAVLTGHAAGTSEAALADPRGSASYLLVVRHTGNHGELIRHAAAAGYCRAIVSIAARSGSDATCPHSQITPFSALTLMAGFVTHGSSSSRASISRASCASDTVPPAAGASPTRGSSHGDGSRCRPLDPRRQRGAGGCDDYPAFRRQTPATRQAPWSRRICWALPPIFVAAPYTMCRPSVRIRLPASTPG